MDSKQYSCCFTGHRPEKLDAAEDDVIRLLDAAIEDALRDGYTTFISGASKGVDLWAGELVVQHRRSRPDIALVCAVPYEGFGLHWRDGWSDLFQKIICEADSVQYVCKAYSRSAFQCRNKYMVDRSSRVIAAYNGASGGTRNTIKYAERQDCDIRFLPLSDGPCCL